MSFAVFVVEYDTTVQLRPTSWQLMSLQGNLCVMFEILAKNFTGNFCYCTDKITASFYLLICMQKSNEGLVHDEKCTEIMQKEKCLKLVF